MQGISEVLKTEILENPLNFGLLLLLGYFAFKTLQPQPAIIVAEQKPIIQRDFTPRELADELCEQQLISEIKHMPK